MVSISACHAEHLGSIPSRDDVFSIKCDIFTLILCGGLDCIVVSTSVCGTESSGSNPDRDLPFGLDHFSRLERLISFSSFFTFGTRASTWC